MLPGLADAGVMWQGQSRRMIDSRDWRIRNLYLILDEDGHTVPLSIRDEQDRFLRERHTRNMVPKSRKLGLSTIIVLDNLDACLFTGAGNLQAGIVDLTEPDAFDKLAIAKFAWDNGPMHPDPEIAEIWRMIHKVNPLVEESKGALAWKNGSRFTAGTSYTGKTPQRLHISEYGPIAAQFPEKAGRIKRGSMNAVPPNGIIDVETTMEGGRFGECYAIFKLAMESAGRNDLTPLDWKLHFFPWHGHPSYILPGREPRMEETRRYFDGLKEKHGLDIPLDRQAWYEAKGREQGENMWQQFPSVIEECDRAVVAGQILPYMTTLRAKGRVCEFEPEPGEPLFTFWDLGSSDNSAGWLVQFAGTNVNVLDWCAGEGKGAAGVAEVVAAWERKHGEVSQHYVPHDANITDKGSGKTYRAQLVEAGIPSGKITVIPRTPDVWVGIEEMRKGLPRCWFHSRCDVEVVDDMGIKLPGGVGRLEGYRRSPQTSAGVVKAAPFPDICSHSADAFRALWESLSAGLINRQGARRFDVQGMNEIVMKSKAATTRRGGITIFERGAVFQESADGWLDMLEPPIKGRLYIAGYCEAQGRHAFGVLRCDHDEDRLEPVNVAMVAAHCDEGWLDADEAAQRVRCMTEYYGGCVVVLASEEVEASARMLRDAGCAAVWQRVKRGDIGNRKGVPLPGWRLTDDFTQPMADLARRVREHEIECFSKAAQDQLAVFMRNPRGDASAVPGEGDAWVRALALAVHCSSAATPFSPATVRRQKFADMGVGATGRFSSL